MESKIQLITDSTTSLTPEELEKIGVDYVETSYMLDSENYSAFDSQDVSLETFYEKLDQVKSCSTGCINTQTFEDVFDKYAKQGIEVLYVGLGAGLSSTFSNATIASETINNKYGKKIIAVVDGRGASYGTLILIERAQQLINNGKTLQEIADEVDKIAKNMTVSFVCRDLNFLYKCGRLSAVGASIGKLLRIVPIIYLAEDGKLKVGDKCIGSKLAFKTLKKKLVEAIISKHYKSCYITSCGMNDDVELLKNYILENTDIKEIKTGLIDKTLACCCGPKTIAIFCG